MGRRRITDNTAQLQLFAPPEPPPWAKPCSKLPQTCFDCKREAIIYGGRVLDPWLEWDTEGTLHGRVALLCGACTITSVRAAKMAGINVPPGYSWAR